MANVTMGLDELLASREEKSNLLQRISSLQEDIKKKDQDIQALKDEKKEQKEDYEKRLEEVNNGTRVIVKKYVKVLPNISDIILKVKASLLSSREYWSDSMLAQKIEEEILSHLKEVETSRSMVNFDDIKLQVEKSFEEEIDKEKEAWKQKNQKLDESIASARKDLDVIYAQKENDLKEHYNKKEESLQEEYDKLKEELENRSKDYNELQKKYSDLQNKFTEISDRKEVRIAELTRTIEEAQAKLAQLQTKKHWWQV